MSKINDFSGAEIVATLDGKVIGKFNAIDYKPPKERINTRPKNIDMSFKLEGIPSENVDKVLEHFNLFLEKIKHLRNSKELD